MKRWKLFFDSFIFSRSSAEDMNVTFDPIYLKLVFRNMSAFLLMQYRNSFLSTLDTQSVPLWVGRGSAVLLRMVFIILVCQCQNPQNHHCLYRNDQPPCSPVGAHTSPSLSVTRVGSFSAVDGGTASLLGVTGPPSLGRQVMAGQRQLK